MTDRRWTRWPGPLAVLVAVLWAATGLDIDLGRIGRAPEALRRLLDGMFPPDWSSAGLIWEALIETIQMAVLATVAGLLLSIPLGLLAARNLFPAWLATPARLLAAGIRVLPIILWAIVAVLVFGVGPLAGIVAMALYTIGYLGKLQSEAFEGIPRDALDAVRAMGLGRGTVAWHVAIPEAANALRSQALFMFEYNIRNSSVVGIVGAGGIGILIEQYLTFFDHARLAAVFIVMYVTVVLIDALSYRIRRRYIEVDDAPRARWRDAFWPRAD